MDVIKQILEGEQALLREKVRDFSNSSALKQSCSTLGVSLGPLNNTTYNYLLPSLMQCPILAIPLDLLLLLSSAFQSL